MKFHKTENYQDVVGKLFPNEVKTQDNLPRTITFAVCDYCNLACKYCYEHHKQNHSMSFETAKKFIDMILDDDENTAQYIDSNNIAGAIIEFIGGEPFLEIDLIDKISDYFVQQCILRNHPWATRHMFSICSNGVLYFDPKVQSYIRKHRNNLSLSISIDGNKELHDSCRVFPDGSGSYDIAMKAVKHYMSEYGRDMGSKMTLCPENIQYTFEAVKSLISDGYYDINLNCVYEEGWNVEHAKILYEKLKELSDYVIENDYYDRHISIFEQKFFHPKSKDDTQTWCGAGGGKMIAVDYSGNIYPCVRFMPMSLGDKVPAVIIGNVNDGIMVRQEHKDCAHCIQNITRINQSTKECIECSIAEGCADCQGYNYEISGNFHTRATYICIMHKARSLANAYYWNKLFRKLGENKRFKIWLDDEEALKIIDKKELDYLKNLSSCEY